MIWRATGFLKNRMFEVHLLKIEGIDKSIDYPHRVLSADVFVKRFGEQYALIAAGAFDIVHADLPIGEICKPRLLSHRRDFLHSLSLEATGEAA